jgi:hypothetical protein
MDVPGYADDEFWALSTDEGRALLASVEESHCYRPVHLERWRARADARHVAAAIRLIESRRRGASKFGRAGAMWLDRTGLEQSTSEVVARHKARRFAGRARVVFDLCSGIGGDALALAEGSDVVAVDADEGMCRRALWNAAVYGVRDRVAAVRGKAERIALPARAWVHVDPDRRARSYKRASRLADYVPGPDFFQTLCRAALGGAIKLGPASDFEGHFRDGGVETEVVSLAGECKEVTAWFGEASTCRRRATCLPAGATWTDRDGPDDWYAPVGPTLGWVFDPDPSLAVSGLLDGFALAHGLTRFVAGADLLTGPVRIGAPFLAAFEVVAVLPLDLKTIKREVAARRIGHLEIKTRGLDRRPEELRKQLRAEGDERATLLLAAGASTGRAVLARRV